ncbi:hypothetical protein EYC84_005472 [Monilinia fructicola]|uniref:Uncharacterized protein n=1 Tax=Monilinia fructicola TaxID=38448 RepID=A0A5M9JZ36_MONFR|nr:hypothetical protein EYC84_005472 [Monilinia fructicola]
MVNLSKNSRHYLLSLENHSPHDPFARDIVINLAQTSHRIDETGFANIYSYCTPYTQELSVRIHGFLEESYLSRVLKNSGLDFGHLLLYSMLLAHANDMGLRFII